MRRWGLFAAGALVFVFVASQILVPSLGERTIEDRLTQGGGTAEVTLGAFPAARLLFSDGERLEVDARDLELELTERQGVFEKLDGFSIVDVAIASSTAGPIELESFRLHRDGEEPYALTASGNTTASELTAFGLEQLDVPGGSLLDLILDPFVDDVEAAVPVELEMRLASDSGGIRVVSGDGEIAGFEAGPLAELITSAVIARL